MTRPADLSLPHPLCALLCPGYSTKLAAVRHNASISLTTCEWR